MSKAGVFGRDKVIAIGKPRKQRLIHSRGRWQSVKQENRGGIFRPRLSIEDGESIHLYCAIKNERAHRSFTSPLSEVHTHAHLEHANDYIRRMRTRELD